MGIGAGDYRDITWKLLDAHDIDVFVAVLYELDKLNEDELLRSLIPAKESGNSDAHIGAFCVSNKIEYRDRLNERLDS
jgi:cell division control protein 6